MGQSDLPNVENEQVMRLAIAWNMAKESTRLMQYGHREEMLKALIEDFIKAREAISAPDTQKPEF